MLSFLLRLVFVVIAFRFVGALVRALTAGRTPPRVPAPRPAKPLVDRASAIDVPFTEEAREG